MVELICNSQVVENEGLEQVQLQRFGLVCEESEFSGSKRPNVV